MAAYPAALSAALNPTPGLEPTAALPPWPDQWGFLSGVREPSPETPRPAVIAQLRLPRGGCQLFRAFPVGGTPTLFHLPPYFQGLLHLQFWNVARSLHVVPWPHTSSALLPPSPRGPSTFFCSCLKRQFSYTLYHSVDCSFRSVFGGPRASPRYRAKDRDRDALSF